MGHDEMDRGRDMRGVGCLGVTEREREQGPLAIDGKRGEGWNEQACRTGGGRGVWAETLLNEEAVEPFLLLSNCMLLCLSSREGERAS